MTDDRVEDGRTRIEELARRAVGDLRRRCVWKSEGLAAWLTGPAIFRTVAAKEPVRAGGGVADARAARVLETARDVARNRSARHAVTDANGTRGRTARTRR